MVYVRLVYCILILKNNNMNENKKTLECVMCEKRTKDLAKSRLNAAPKP